MNTRFFTVPLLLSLALHGLVVAVVLFAWEGRSEPRTIERPNIVQAKVVEFTPASQREAEAEAAQQEVIDMRERQRRQQEQEAERQRQQEAERQRQAREREQEAQRERQQREEAERQQAERERQQAEQERRQQEQAEQQAAAERQRRQEQLEQALAEEDEFLQARQSEVAAQSYVNTISSRIENNWSRPPSARLGMQCVLEIQLVPTGRVVDVKIVESSGNAAFDRAAEQAVRRIDQFDEVRDMPSDVFERHFRQLRLVFNPEDLRL